MIAKNNSVNKTGWFNLVAILQVSSSLVSYVHTSLTLISGSVTGLDLELVGWVSLSADQV